MMFLSWFYLEFFFNRHFTLTLANIFGRALNSINASLQEKVFDLAVNIPIGMPGSQSVWVWVPVIGGIWQWTNWGKIVVFPYVGVGVSVCVSLSLKICTILNVCITQGKKIRSLISPISNICDKAGWGSHVGMPELEPHFCFRCNFPPHTNLETASDDLNTWIFVILVGDSRGISSSWLLPASSTSHVSTGGNKLGGWRSVSVWISLFGAVPFKEINKMFLKEMYF